MTEQDSAGAAPAATGKKDKAPPPNLVIPPKKPKLTKAERRALQEAQRAAKAGKAGGGGEGGGSKPKPQPQGNSQGEGQPLKQQNQQPSKQDNSKSGGEAGYGNDGESGGRGGGTIRDQDSGNNDKAIELFSHLPPYRDPSIVIQSEYQHQELLHPAVLELGRDFAQGTIRGGNARCRAMLETFSRVLQDYVPPPGTTDYRTHLDQFVLKPSFTYWTTQCRPHSVSMGNAFTFLKTAVSSLDRELPYDDGTMGDQGGDGSNNGDNNDAGGENDNNGDDFSCAKQLLLESIHQFMQERLDYADRAIAQHALSKISTHDVLLTFGYSEVIHVLLETAANELRLPGGASNKENKANSSKPKKSPFFVWVVDTAPLWEGRRMVQELQRMKIACGYCTLNALSFVMDQKQVTKVFLGASALMTNGSVFGRAGTAGVALMAQDAHIPVLVCCETYKISNRVPQLESITYNELGNPESLVLASSSASPEEGDASSSTLANWKQVPNLKLLNLLYDVTPSDFVSGVVTEVGIIPPSSVAVLLREMNPQDTAFS